jgi:lipid-A-disaccharide synthase
MTQVAARLKQKYPTIKFIASAVSDEKLIKLQQHANPDINCTYVIDSTVATCIKSDFAIVASGSATLQVAATACPMVIIYKANRLMWHLLGRWLITTRFLSLVNILAGNELVPEFMPYFTSTNPIYTACADIIADNNKLQKTSNALQKITATLGDGKTAGKVAAVVMDMLSKK